MGLNRPGALISRSQFQANRNDDTVSTLASFACPTGTGNFHDQHCPTADFAHGLPFPNGLRTLPLSPSTLDPDFTSLQPTHYGPQKDQSISILQGYPHLVGLHYRGVYVVYPYRKMLHMCFSGALIHLQAQAHLKTLNLPKLKGNNGTKPLTP